MAPPLTVGLTGGIAAGKSEALSALERLGVATISSDAIVHDLLGTERVRDTLAERWGPQVVSDGVLDRAAIGEVVFADRSELDWLESQLHPLVGERIASWLVGLPEDTEIAVVEVPLLFESGMGGAFDRTVAIITPEQLRQERAEARGHSLVSDRDSRQLSQEDKAARADHAIRNDGTVDELESALAILVAELRDSRSPADSLEGER